jgi:energy-coupling factor transporter ATP-binding protein EcfA2
MSAAGLRAEGITVRLKGHAVPVLSGASLELRPGEVVGVCGRSGAGKSTLLHVLAGLVPWARPAAVEGKVVLNGEEITDLDPGQRAHLLATCLDRPDAQLFLATPRQELAAAHRLHGRTPLVAEIAATLGLEPLLDRRVTGLSSGERQRVALAVALAGAPRPVLLDEPTVHLDEDGVAALVRVLVGVRRQGGTVLVSEHAGWRLAGGVDRWLELKGGTLTPCFAPEPPALAAPPATSGEVILEASALTVVRGGRTLVEGATLSVRAGEVVLLSGPNGAGKSSLTRVLAGHAAAAGGGLTVAAGTVRRPNDLALLLPEANVQLFSDSVAGELALAHVDLDAAAEVLRAHRLEHLSGRAPWTLSRGERQRLVHAALDALRPGLMIVDEPGQGLDPEDLADLTHLMRERAAAGRAYLIASHRLELAGFAHRHVVIAEGGLVEAAL